MSKQNLSNKRIMSTKLLKLCRRNLLRYATHKFASTTLICLRNYDRTKSMKCTHDISSENNEKCKNMDANEIIWRAVSTSKIRNWF